MVVENGEAGNGEAEDDTTDDDDAENGGAGTSGRDQRGPASVRPSASPATVARTPRTTLADA
ncbi:hypothetical protein rosag_35490 [Roseisolibacter agri]|uniref:Uncharacterized protein n=1 Tax=Roseisolibacter agri TaxID=2014610 RepID=A0AA37QDS3_9BACT|nr:hypothetical protein rosag_35490 [Roseisolibacter agri]